jgi:hypothetical protein
MTQAALPSSPASLPGTWGRVTRAAGREGPTGCLQHRGSRRRGRWAPRVVSSRTAHRRRPDAQGRVEVFDPEEEADAARRRDPRHPGSRLPAASPAGTAGRRTPARRRRRKACTIGRRRPLAVIGMSVAPLARCPQGVTIAKSGSVVTTIPSRVSRAAGSPVTCTSPPPSRTANRTSAARPHGVRVHDRCRSAGDP